MIVLEFVAGRGGAGRVYTRQAPPLHQPGGDIFRVTPALPPVPPTYFNGGPSGEWAGRGAGAGNPKKNTPCPGPFGGAGRGMGRGPRFSGPRRPRNEL